MRAYITKYWDTEGIFPLEGKALEGGYFKGDYADGPFFGSSQVFAPREWALSTNDAMDLAKDLRSDRLVVMAKEAQRLIEMEIKVTP